MKGEFQHTIDAKGRMIIPSRLRDELGDGFIVTKGLDGCLFIYSKPDWAVLEEKIRALPLSKSRKLQRFLFSSAIECEPDAQGRILVPQNLREHANLSKEIFVIGVSGRVEVWDADNWRRYNGEMTSETVAEAMEELGF